MDKRWVLSLIAAPAVLGEAGPALSATVHNIIADAPTALAVTVYRDPSRDTGEIDFDNLGGFALIRETRTVHIPAGESRVRFEGVADGIQPASALIEGLGTALIEKDRDARLLSPLNLVASALGKPVILVRSNAKTGKVERVTGKILADNAGVVFQTEAGVEALRCSGLSETFEFTNSEGLSSTPTLSVLVRTSVPLTKVITLSYLASGFDWTASYTATLSADGSKMDLGAWVTLANSNGVSFPAAHTQVVAGRVHVEDGDTEPIDLGGPILAWCWPPGSTSASAGPLYLAGAVPFGFEDRMFKRAVAIQPVSLQETVVTAQRRVIQEQLGDLKLYRVPERTTVASHQSKQVRLLDRLSIPVHRMYGVELDEEAGSDDTDPSPRPVSVLLRTKNTVANHLGLPLPSGAVALFASSPRGPLLLKESNINDMALDEDVEIPAGSSYDVQLKVSVEKVDIDPAKAKKIPLVPGVSLRQVEVDDARRVEISNARAADVEFELRVQLQPGARLIRADHPFGKRNGRPVFRLPIPAHQRVTVRYQTAHEREQTAPE